MKELQHFYTDLFKAETPREATDRANQELFSCLLNGISNTINQMLVKPANEVETKCAVFEMRALELRDRTTFQELSTRKTGVSAYRHMR